MADIAKLRKAIEAHKAHWKENLGRIPRPQKEEDGTVTVALFELVVNELESLSKEVEELKRRGVVTPIPRKPN